jgi:hypothetical protein
VEGERERERERGLGMRLIKKGHAGAWPEEF